MVMNTYIWTIRRWSIVFVVLSDLVEVIFIQLSNEAGKVAVLKMFRENQFCELFILSSTLISGVVVIHTSMTYLKYHKAFTPFSPTYNGLVRRILEHSMVPRISRLLHQQPFCETLVPYLYNLRTCNLVS